MTPTRWDSTYADRVREALLTRIADEGPAPDHGSAQLKRRNTLRLVVAFAIALTVVVPASIFAFSTASRHATIAGPQPTATPVEAGEPLPGRALIGLWKVRSEGEARTWAEVEPGRFTIQRDGHVIEGSWSTADDRLATSVTVWSSGADPTVSWFLRARAFRIQGDDRALLAADGAVLAVLEPATAAPSQQGGSFEALMVPTVSPSSLAKLTVPVLPPGHERQLTENDLLGTWVADRKAARTPAPSVRFKADGTQLATDGCNGVVGGWNIASGNQLLVTSGFNGEVGCGDALDIPSAIARTRTIAINGTALTLFDESGDTLVTLHRP